MKLATSSNANILQKKSFGELMIKGNKFKGNLTITARWDLDGLAKASPGDIEGSVTVPSGSVDVKIFLAQIY